MNIFPAIDIINGQAVRLYKGDYDKMTVYESAPTLIARRLEGCNAHYLHVVDLDGAKKGEICNIDTVKRIREATSMFIEVGGGIRNIKSVDEYLSVGIDRIILGTSACNDEPFLKECIAEYGGKIAVGVDMKDGYVAVNGWCESSGKDGEEFCQYLQTLGVQTIICTDISRDGAMRGTNRELYGRLCKNLSINITASGGVSSIDDVKALKKLGLYGCIIGKAYYTGDIDIKEALEAAK